MKINSLMPEAVYSFDQSILSLSPLYSITCGMRFLELEKRNYGTYTDNNWNIERSY